MKILKNISLIFCLFALPAAAQSLRRNSATTNVVPVATYVGGVLSNSITGNATTATTATNVLGVLTNAVASTAGGITNRFDGFWGNAIGLTNHPNSGLRITTNAAPSGVVLSNTPDSWMIITGTNAVIYYLPLWIAH